MYVISAHGFYSFARLDLPGQEGPSFVIRSRARRDLANLLSAARLETRIKHTPTRDYPWRIHVNPEELRPVLLALGEAIGAGGDLKAHPSRGDLYGTVWALMTKIRDK